MVAVVCSGLACWYEFCRRGKKASWFEGNVVALTAENASGVKEFHDHLVWPGLTLGSHCDLTDEPWLAHLHETGLRRHAVPIAVLDLTSRGHRRNLNAVQCLSCRPEDADFEASIATSTREERAAEGRI